MQTQIVYGAHTPAYIWDALKARATETRIRLDARCPDCGGEIKETDSDFHCDSLQGCPSLSSNTNSSAMTQIHA